MYWSNIKSEDIKIFKDTVKNNISYTETPDELFISTPNKKVPLFNFDTINTPETIQVLENKCLLYTNQNDLNNVYFTENSIRTEYQVIITKTNRYLELIFYDPDSYNSLPHFEFNLQYVVNDDILIDDDFTSNMIGEKIIDLNTTQHGLVVLTVDNNERRINL